MEQSNQNLKNLFDQLSEVNNVDDHLRDEGLDPAKVVSEGLKKLESIQIDASSKGDLVELIKSKLSQITTKQNEIVLKGLNSLATSMSKPELIVVYRNLHHENVTPDEKLMKELKNDPELSSLMKEFHDKKRK